MICRARITKTEGGETGPPFLASQKRVRGQFGEWSCVAGFGLLFFVALLSQKPPSSALPAAIASQEWRIIRLAESEQDGFHFVTTGFALVRKQKTYVITSGHIREKVKNPFELYADFAAPVKAHPARILSVDRTADVAVLETDIEGSGRTEERAGEAHPGTTVFIVGFDDAHTTRDTLNVESGLVQMVGLWVEGKHLFVPSGKYPGPAAPGLLLSGVTCRPGGSGSPVFGSDGDILGVMKGFTEDGKCLVIGIRPALTLLGKYSK
jgi:trypsin-like peptidase